MIEEGKMSHFSFSDQKYFESVSFCITKMKEKFEDEIKYQKLEFQMKLKEQQEENYNMRNEFNNTITSLLIFNINTNKNNNVNTFNYLKGESQTLILAGILEDTRNEHFYPIGDLLSYLSQEQIKANYKFNQKNYIRIQMKNERDSSNALNNININDIESITIEHRAIEMLYQNSSLKSKEFINQIKNFDNLYLELEYNAKLDESIYKTVSIAKEESYQQMKIGIVINKIDENDQLLKKFMNFKRFIFSSPLTRISSSFLYGCQSITELIIGPTITEIEEGAFNSCENLQKVTIHSSISNSTFKNCKSLKEITIPQSVTSICKCSFEGCTSLDRIEIPSSVVSIKSSAFKECKSLMEITIPESVTTIEDNSFEGCTLLEKVVLSQSTTTIGKSCFSSCSSLKECFIDWRQLL